MMSSINSCLFFVIFICTFICKVNSLPRFANYYQDHMVLQRAPQRAVVWGYSDTSNSPITLTMNGRVYTTNAADQIWSVTLDAQSEEGPFDIHVNQPLTNGTVVTITLHDILFGDVWICSGQSNMQFSVYEMLNATIEIDNAGKYPKVRFMTTQHNQSETLEEELLGITLNWTIASPDSVGSNFTSAVCWLYGRMIHQALGGRPMGLVHTSWGATEIEFWAPKQALQACNVTNDLGIIVNNSVLYNAMIHPLTRMVIKGAIWYQGEDNIRVHTALYPCMFSKMIETWRSVWHERTKSLTDPNFPFGFVQLSTKTKDPDTIGGFPWVRWHQTFDVGHVPNDVVQNVFMASAMDLRDDDAP